MQIILNLYILCDIATGLNWIKIEGLVIIIFVDVFFMWLQLLYWLRLFPKTTLYISLLQQTIYDVVPFLSIFGISVMAFANVFMVLNSVRINDESEQLYTTVWE